MILNAEEFIKLRKSSNPNDYNRAASEEASIDVWLDVLNNYPDMKKWVIHNKKIPIKILDKLSRDFDPEIRVDVARKRKIIDTPIFKRLAKDKDENVRYALMWNTKLNFKMFKMIDSSGSEWFRKIYNERLNVFSLK